MRNSFRTIKRGCRTAKAAKHLRGLTFEVLENRALLTAVVESQALNTFSITGNLGEKPESKIWKHAGNWWGVFSDSGGTHVWRLDGATWTKSVKISALKGIQVDVKSDGDVTHVLFENNLNSQLVSVKYVPGPVPTYEPWPDRPAPATVKLVSSVEAATIDIDSTGRMWVAYDDDKKNIEVKYSDAPYSTWSNPIVLANNVDKDDIVALAAMPSGRIGALWSNQTTKQFGFRTHVDGTDPTVWTADEVPASASSLNIPDGFADDHINLAVGSDGTFYAAVKTSYSPVGSPEMGILVRRPNGVWDDFHDLKILDGTRPIIQLNEVTNTLIFSYDDDSNWVYHECHAKTIVCTGPKVLVSEGDNGTSTKQNVTTDLVVLTSGKSSSSKVYGTLLKFNATNTAPTSDAGPDLAIYDTQIADLHGTVSDDGLPGFPGSVTTTWSKVSGPGIVSFSDETAHNTSATFSEPGEYVLELSATDGELTTSDTVTITVTPTPPNHAPLVHVPDDVTIGIAEANLFEGSVSDDGLPFTPGSVSLQWSQLSGPGTVTFGERGALETTATFSEIGVYTLQLSAFDGDLTGSDEIVVTVNLLPPNHAPVVDAGHDQTIVFGNPASLVGSFTDDLQPVPAESVLTTWSLISGPGDVLFSDATSLTTSATFSQPGNYLLELSADDTEFVGHDTIAITVSDLPPVTKSFQDGALPSVAYRGTRDTKLRGDKLKSNYGKDKRLEVQGKPDYTSLIEWDISEIPAGSTVLGASISIYVEGNSKNSYRVYEVLKDWVELEATFQHAANDALWSFPGAAGIDNDRGSTALGTISAPKKGLVSVELNEAGIAVVQKWISNPSSNHGIILQDFTDTLRDDLDFTSREGSKVLNRPKLNIRYLPVGPSTPPLLTSALTNIDNPLDVNADTRVTPLDALLVINTLNTRLPEGEEGTEAAVFFLDVTGDGTITPLDALSVINFLNDSPIGEGEGALNSPLISNTALVIPRSTFEHSALQLSARVASFDRARNFTVDEIWNDLAAVPDRWEDSPSFDDDVTERKFSPRLSEELLDCLVVDGSDPYSLPSDLLETWSEDDDSSTL